MLMLLALLVLLELWQLISSWPQLIPKMVVQPRLSLGCRSTSSWVAMFITSEMTEFSSMM